MESINIFFDLDDTLVNTRQTILRRIILLLERFSLNIEPLLVYSLLGNSQRESILVQYTGQKTDFWRDYEFLRREIVVGSIPGANETMETLISQGKRIGILTNNTLLKTLEKLSSAKIDKNLFRGNIHSCLEMGCLKPSPRIVAYRRLDSRNTVYVGDDIIDYAFAVNSGMDFYAVCTGEYVAGDFIQRGLRVGRVFPTIKEVLQG